MGKLRELLKAHSETEDETERIRLEEQIHGIEKWMIEKGIAGKTELTVFRIEAGNEDPRKCGICMAKSKEPHRCIQTLWNGRKRKICFNCKESIDKGMEVYNSKKSIIN